MEKKRDVIGEEMAKLVLSLTGNAVRFMIKIGKWSGGVCKNTEFINPLQRQSLNLA